MKRLLAPALIGLLALAGCSKLNLKNYDQLELGMSQAEVESFIGGPDQCDEMLGTRSCIWGDKDSKFIKVSFVANKAISYSNKGLN